MSEFKNEMMQSEVQRSVEVVFGGRLMREPRQNQRAHSTPDPDSDPPRPSPNPDDVPPPVNAPVQEPTLPEPPIKARPALVL